MVWKRADWKIVDKNEPRNFPAIYVATALMGMLTIGLLMVAIWEPILGGATFLIAATAFFLSHKALKSQEKENQSPEWHNVNISRLMAIQLGSVMLGIFSVMCLLQDTAAPLRVILAGLVCGAFFAYTIVSKHSPHDKSAIGWMAGGVTAPAQKSD